MFTRHGIREYGEAGHSHSPTTPIPIHPVLSAIEFILKHLTPKSLRRPHPSASLFMDTVSPHLALASFACFDPKWNKIMNGTAVPRDHRVRVQRPPKLSPTQFLKEK